MIEFGEGIRITDLQHTVTRQDLIQSHIESIDYLLSLIEGLPDSFVSYEPDDPEALDEYAADGDHAGIAWTLAHLILHTTASCEEKVAQGASLARGVEVTWRDRYEPHWDEVKTITGLKLRLEESRRMRIAYLNTWPDQPHLDNFFHHGKVNACGVILAGLRHEVEHYVQIEEVIRQARAAESGESHQAM